MTEIELLAIKIEILAAVGEQEPTKALCKFIKGFAQAIQATERKKAQKESGNGSEE